MNIGDRIHNIRLGLGLTMEQFGELFEPPVVKGTISKWENGSYAPNRQRMKRIAELGDISVKELTEGNEFGEHLKMLRENKYLCLQELADLTGVSRPYISQIESGKKGIPSYSVVIALADALEVERESLAKIAGYTNVESESKTTEITDLIVLNELTHKGEVITFEQKQKILTMLDVILN